MIGFHSRIPGGLRQCGTGVLALQAAQPFHDRKFVGGLFYSYRTAENLANCLFDRAAVTLADGHHDLDHTVRNGTVFPFPGRGELAYILQRELLQRYGDGIREIGIALSRERSLIDTNGAYQLATQWVAAISVDVVELERTFRPLSAQQEYYDPPISLEQYLAKGVPKDAPKKKRPIFDVTWGGIVDDPLLVWVEILGTTKELVLLRMENTTFLKRPANVITNALKSNARPDPPGKQLRPSSRGTEPDEPAPR